MYIIKEQKKYDLYRSFFFRDVVQVNNADEIITDKLALCSGKYMLPVTFLIWRISRLSYPWGEGAKAA